MKMKTWTLLIAIFVFSIMTKAQTKTFTLNGQMSGATKDSVTFIYADQSGKRITSAQSILNNKFSISGNINKPTISYISFKNKGEVIPRGDYFKRTKEVFLEPTIMQIMGDPDVLASLKVTNSKTQEEYETLNKLVEPIRVEEQPILDLYSKEKDHEKAAAIREQFAPFNERIKKVTYQFFLDHPHSYVTSDRLLYYVSSLTLDSVKRVYNSFTANQKETANAKRVATEVKQMDAGSPGNMATVFTATDINGKSLSLADFKGKYVLLDFWASWCVPCRHGNPHLIELYKKYQNQGLEIVGISDDDRNPKSWKDAVAKDSIGIWHHVLRGLDMDARLKNLPNPGDISDKYGIHSLPTKILINPEGKIIGRYGDSIGQPEEALDQLLAKVFSK
jgi:thiol-disulfide isomerase/thioredoxin